MPVFFSFFHAAPPHRDVSTRPRRLCFVSASLLNPIIRFFSLSRQSLCVLAGAKRGVIMVLACSGKHSLEVMRRVRDRKVSPLTSHGCPLLPPGSWRIKEERKKRKEERKSAFFLVIEGKKDV